MAPHEYYHVYNLPAELLESLTPRNDLSRSVDPLPLPAQSAPEPESGGAPGIGSKSCNVCHGAVFADLDDQRAHFRSDWHRYNVKLRLGGAQAVGETEFGALVDGEHRSRDARVM